MVGCRGLRRKNHVIHHPTLCIVYSPSFSALQPSLLCMLHFWGAVVSSMEGAIYTDEQLYGRPAAHSTIGDTALQDVIEEQGDTEGSAEEEHEPSAKRSRAASSKPGKRDNAIVTALRSYLRLLNKLKPENVVTGAAGDSTASPAVAGGGWDTAALQHFFIDDCKLTEQKAAEALECIQVCVQAHTAPM